jgi:formate C-acetyltransferase
MYSRCRHENGTAITSHVPGYILSPDEDLIVGLQSDQPLKRACKALGGFRVVEAALKSYGYEADDSMRQTYGSGGPVPSHNDLVFSKSEK